MPASSIGLSAIGAQTVPNDDDLKARFDLADGSNAL